MNDTAPPQTQPDENSPDENSPAALLAKARFRKLALVRVYGVVLALIGAAIMAGKAALPPVVGLIVLLIGVFDVLALPRIMIRRWKKAEAKRG